MWIKSWLSGEWFYVHRRWRFVSWCGQAKWGNAHPPTDMSRFPWGARVVDGDGGQVSDVTPLVLSVLWCGDEVWSRIWTQAWRLSPIPGDPRMHGSHFFSMGAKKCRKRYLYRIWSALVWESEGGKKRARGRVSGRHTKNRKWTNWVLGRALWTVLWRARQRHDIQLLTRKGR